MHYCFPPLNFPLSFHLSLYQLFFYECCSCRGVTIAVQPLAPAGPSLWLTVLCKALKMPNYALCLALFSFLSVAVVWLTVLGDFSLCVLNIFLISSLHLTVSLKTQTPSIRMGDGSMKARTPWGGNKCACGHQAEDSFVETFHIIAPRKKRENLKSWTTSLWNSLEIPKNVKTYWKIYFNFFILK